MVYHHPCSDEDWSLSGEGGLLGGGWCSLDGGELGEPEVGLGVLLGGSSSSVGSVDDHGLDDVDVFSSATVSSGQLVVDQGNGVVEGVGPDLLVHVDDSGSGEVLEHHSVQLDGGGLSLEDLAHGHDLSLDLPNFVLSLHLGPEAGFGKHLVLGEDSDSIAGGVGVAVAWELSANHPELSNLKTQQN